MGKSISKWDKDKWKKPRKKYKRIRKAWEDANHD